MKRLAVVNLDVAASEISVELLEIEAAHLARDASPLFSGLFDLMVPDAWVTFPALLQNGNYASFTDCYLWIVGLDR